MAHSGSSRPDPFDEDIEHFDASGRRVGSSSRNLLGDDTIHYDASGRRVGSSSRNLLGDDTIHYDASGRRIGSSSRNLLGDDTIHYDASGRRVGSSSASLLSDATQHDGSWFPGAPSPAGPVGSGYSRFSSARTRVGAAVESIVALLFGSVGLLVAVLVLGIPLSLFREVPAVANLIESLTYESAFGVVLVASWGVVCAVSIVTGQILFTRYGSAYLSGAIWGGSVGLALLLALGLPGLADGWGGAIPPIAALAGHTIGGIIDLRRR